MSMIHLAERQIVGVGLKTEIRKASPVLLKDDILPVVAELMQGRTEYVLVRDKKKFYSDYYESLEIAGVRRLSPYSCRHTTATALAITEGVAPQTIQKIMRWSTTRMLDRYAHPTNDDAITALNNLKKPI